MRIFTQNITNVQDLWPEGPLALWDWLPDSYCIFTQASAKAKVSYKSTVVRVVTNN